MAHLHLELGIPEERPFSLQSPRSVAVVAEATAEAAVGLVAAALPLASTLVVLEPQVRGIVAELAEAAALPLAEAAALRARADKVLQGLG